MQYNLPPIENENRTLDQLKANLRNVIDTGKVLSEAIKKKEREIETRYLVK